MALTTKRIIALPSQTDPQEGDYLAIDNAQGGTHKIPVGRIGVEVDDTLTEAGKAADAKATGDALDEIRSQIEVTGTASGAIATFADGADMPAKSVVVNIEPQQSGTGTPSPDNVRQISGWESVDVNVTGVNVWDEEMEEGFFSTSNGEKIVNNAVLRSTNMTLCKPNTDIYVKISGACSFMWYGANKEFLGYRGTVNANTVITIPDNVHYFNFGIAKANYGHDAYNNDISINYPSTDHEYHAYNGTTTTTSLGRTVYGGTLDVVSGVLTDKMGMVDLGTLNWSLYNGKFTSALNPEPLRKAFGEINMLCSIYKTGTYGSSSSQGDGTIWLSASTSANTVYVEDSRYTDAASFKTAMSGVQLCYELETPQTYTLTPTQINTLLGENNVWADSGDVSVVYVRDLNIAINNLIGE